MGLPPTQGSQLDKQEPEFRSGGRSATPRALVLLCLLFAIIICYVAFTVVRNISSANPEETAIGRATAVAEQTVEASAGATVVASLQTEATETASAMPPGTATALEATVEEEEDGSPTPGPSP